MPRQKLGQHFLYSPAWRERIARTLPTDANTTWLEIGPGHGEMTEFLAQHYQRVIAIETDAALASSLRQRAAGLLSAEPMASPHTFPAHLPAKAAASAATAGWPNVEIVESDILSVDLAKLVDNDLSAPLRKGTASAVPDVSPLDAPSGAEAGRGFHPSESETNAKHFRVYGNLPYYITSPILSYLLRFAAQIESIHIVIQWEVAARIVATPGHREYAYLSALCQYFTRPEVILRIPPGAFRPPPKVNSALLTMNLPGERAHLQIRDEAAFLEFVQNCFSQKRKTLRNNLKNLFTDPQIAAAFAVCKFTPKSRAEEIPLAQFAQLYCLLAPEK